ncbi:MAG: ABC transporter permease [Thermoplasmata archaeon]|nr:MAG: ABC transporter permease [Thermoplasmata archaeon]
MVEGKVSSTSISQRHNVVPSNLQQYFIVVRYELLKYLRSRRLMAMLIILALIIGLILGIPPALGDGYPSDALEFAQLFGTFVSILAMLCFTFFGADAIVSEFQQKTGYILFPNPLNRSVILMGKFTASILSAMLIIMLYYGATMGAIGAINRSLPKEIVLSFLFCLIYLFAGMAVAFLFSSLMKSAALAYVLVFFFFFLIMDIINVMFMAAGVAPWASLTFSSGIIVYILSVPYPTTVDAGPFNIFIPEIGLSLLVMLFYLVIALLITYFIFEKKEMK